MTEAHHPECQMPCNKCLEPNWLERKWLQLVLVHRLALVLVLLVVGARGGCDGTSEGCFCLFVFCGCREGWVKNDKVGVIYI